ncbi:MAG: hypothetical protein K9M36_01460 [Candidatus Pacebacteria bacterium]|nr:hypothetical protein [Candidatus Paceibacterota bacterium]
MNEQFPTYTCSGDAIADANNPRISDSLFLLHYGEDKKTILNENARIKRFEQAQEALTKAEESEQEPPKMAA